MASTAPSDRLLSLDVFRGLTIAGMMMVNNQAGPETYYQLGHSSWHGWTYTDTVFPSFMWIAGVAITLSTAKRVERGENKHTLLMHALRRAVLIFAIGLALTAFSGILAGTFSVATWRIAGVLQRIAIGYLGASLIFLYTKLRGQILWTIAFLLSYWLLMFYYPIPGVGAGHLEKEANLERYVDQLVLGDHIYKHDKYWDPEGIVSTLPSIATVLFGVLTGQILRRTQQHAERAARLFLSGNGLILAGLLLSAWMPINKNLWTVSFAVFMAGISTVLFAACYWICDAKGYRKWAWPCVVYGMNAMAAYIASWILETLVEVIHGGGKSLHEAIYADWFAPFMSAKNASLGYSLLFDLVMFAFVYFLYRRQWFLKL
jgi:predicted acyltransferase